MVLTYIDHSQVFEIYFDVNMPGLEAYVPLYITRSIDCDTVTLEFINSNYDLNILNKYFDIDPENLDPLVANNIGIMYSLLGNIEEARKYYESSNSLYSLINIGNMSTNSDKKISQYKLALNIDRNNYFAQKHIIQVLYDMYNGKDTIQHFNEARKYIQRIINIDHIHRCKILYIAAWWYDSIEEYKVSDNYFKQIVKLDEKVGQNMFYIKDSCRCLAEIYGNRGLNKLAEEYLSILSK